MKKIQASQIQAEQDGSVLLLALLAMTVISVLVGVSFQLTNQNARMTERSLDRTAAQAAAEGALEYAFALWRNELMNQGGPLTANEANALLTNLPAFDGISYVEPVSIRALDAQGQPIGDGDSVPDLANDLYSYEATVRVRADSLGEDTEVGIRRVFEYASTPITRYAFATQDDFELYRPAPMIIAGWMHSNGDVYISTHYNPASSGLLLTSSCVLTYVGNYSEGIPPGGSDWSGDYDADRGPAYEDGKADQLKHVDYIETMGTGSTLEFDTTDSDPNNDGNRELIEPPVVTADYDPGSPIEQARMYNKAGLVVELTGPMGSAPVSGVDTDGDTVPDKYVGDNITITPANGTTLTDAQAQAIQAAITNSEITTETQIVQTGTTTEQVQVGTEQVQVGTERVQVGTEQVQVGTTTEQVQVGTEQVQVGTTTEQVQVGTEQVQVGTEQVQVQVGTERRRFLWWWIDVPVYEWQDVPVYEERPVYEEQQVPVYEERPVYEDREIPVYAEQPVYEERPVYEQQPVYETVTTPVYEERVVETATYKTLYDRRETRHVDIANVDVGTLRPTLESLGTFNDILYIHDSTSAGHTDPKAVRLENGGVLPSDGLTVATENGLYIQGDFNTGTTSDPNSVPSNSGGNPNNTDSPVVSGYDRVAAAVVADAVMVLSNNWDDANSALTKSSRNATNTTVNVAIIAGSIPSLWVNPHNGDGYGYSGGMNNFPRFLESWSGDYLTFFGSMVQLFQSEMFIGEWDTGEIYSPPNRCWNFETLFLTVAPPGAPGTGTTFARGTWTRI